MRGRTVDDGQGLFHNHLPHLPAEVIKRGKQMQRGRRRSSKLPSAIIEAAAIHLDWRVAAIHEATFVKGAPLELMKIHEHRLALELVVLDLHKDVGGYRPSADPSKPGPGICREPGS